MQRDGIAVRGASGRCRLAVRGGRGGLLLGLAVALVLQGPVLAQSGASAWVVGGHGVAWRTQAERWIALEDTTRPGSMRLQQLSAGQNLLGEQVRENINIPRNVFGYKWTSMRGRYGMEVDTLLIGWHPRIWQGGGAEATGLRTLLDGDELTAVWVYALTGTQQRTDVTWFTLDLGVPIPIDSVVFMPPQYGLHSSGQLFRAMSPEAYEVSRTNDPIDWLIYDDETTSTGSSKYHGLKDVIGSTYSNNESVVGLPCPLRFTRFIRLRFGGVRTTGVLSEIKAFGRGFPQEGRYLSVVHSFGEPVSFGKVYWHFTRYRLDAQSGAITEDPNAPVTVAIRTRSGDDADPQAYYKYDELGRQIEVDRATYYAADAPLGSYEDGLPDFRAALLDDVGHWNSWSVVYGESGDQIRSSDGRQFFQFRIEMATEDPLAFGILDSLAFEISPLLADSVVAEVSLAGQPGTHGVGVEVPLGADTVFVYDLRTAFTGKGKPGFDTVELDVPAGSRLESLEIDGVAAVEGSDYSLLPAQEGRLEIAFPAPIQRTTNLRARIRGAVYQRSVFFGGQVVDRATGATYLPQSIEGGDVNPESRTDGIQVVGTQAKLSVIENIRLSSPVVTPNGDGVNDQTTIGFDLFGVEGAPVSVEVYDLSGRRVAVVFSGTLGAGRYQPAWSGRGAGEAVVPPGLYVVRLQADVDEGSFTRVVPVSVAY